MTGQELYLDFRNRIHQSYSAYLDPTKANRLFKRALYILAEKSWMRMFNEKQFDDLRYQVTTEREYAVNNNKFSVAPILIKKIAYSSNTLIIDTRVEHDLEIGQVISISDYSGIAFVPLPTGLVVTGVPSLNTFEVRVQTAAGVHVDGTGIITHDKMVTDYLHLFSVRCKTYQSIGAVIREVKGNVILLTKRSNLRSGELIKIENYGSGLDGDWYVGKLTDNKIRLYYDEDLTIVSPLFGNITTIGGNIYRQFYEVAESIDPNEKISIFQKGAVDGMKYEIADGKVKFYPTNVPVEKIKVDYFALPPVTIDATDNIIDLTRFYPYIYLNRLISEAVILYAQPSRDQLLEATSIREEQRNP